MRWNHFFCRTAVNLWSLSAVSCGNTGTFQCLDDASCPSGRCEQTGRCSFPSEDCPSGRRYGEHSGSFSGQCVVDEGQANTSSSSPTSSGTTGTNTGDGSTTSDGERGGSREMTSESTAGWAGCGNRRLEVNEACDDGNFDDLDGCTQNCVVGPVGVFLGRTEQTAFAGGASSTGISSFVDICPKGQVLSGLHGSLNSDVWLGLLLGGLCRPVVLTNTDPPSFMTNDPTTELPSHGSSDETAAWRTDCLVNEVVVAVRGSAGSVIEGVEVRCASLNTNGTPGAYGLELIATAWLEPQGSSGGGRFGPLECPSGTVATGVETETATGAETEMNNYVVRIRLLCTELDFNYAR